MDNKDFGKMLEQRTKVFALEIIRFSATLPYTPEWKIIRNQLSRSGTSIGANYREANRSRSNADFKHKIKICEAEAGESKYWLEIIMELQEGADERILRLLKETEELLALFTSIGNKIKTS